MLNRNNAIQISLFLSLFISSPTFSADTTPAPTADLSNVINFKPIRINAGGNTYIDSKGYLWQADANYNTGNAGIWSIKKAAATSEPSLYATERWIGKSMPYLEYSFDVPNGAYSVKLHFIDHVFDTAGRRITNVTAEEQQVLDGIDTVKEVGKDAVLIKNFSTNVQDGQLNIKFLRVIDNPNISAIEITKAETGSDPTLTLQWSKNPEQISGYIVYYGATPETASEEVSKISIDSRTFDPDRPSIDYRIRADLALNALDNVCFRIKSYNSVATSDFSEAICSVI